MVRQVARRSCVRSGREPVVSRRGSGILIPSSSSYGWALGVVADVLFAVGFAIVAVGERGGGGRGRVGRSVTRSVGRSSRSTLRAPTGRPAPRLREEAPPRRPRAIEADDNDPVGCWLYGMTGGYTDIMFNDAAGTADGDREMRSIVCARAAL